MSTNPTVPVKAGKGRPEGYSPKKISEGKDIMNTPIISRFLEVMSCLNHAKATDPYVRKARSIVNGISLGELHELRALSL